VRAYIIRRLALFPVVLLAASLLIFGLVRILPGSAVETLLQESLVGQDVKQYEHQLGLDRPLPVQYLTWARGAIHGDLGTSLLSKQSVVARIDQALPVTAELTLFSLLITAIIGVTGGALAAVFQDRWPDHLLRGGSVLLLAVPDFWLATLVVTLPAVYFHWAPSPTYHPLLKAPGSNLVQFLIPAAVFGLHTAAVSLRLTRSQLLEVLHQDYVRTARAKGLAEQTVVLRHALRSAMPPVITVLGTQLGYLLGGAVIIETIFGLPGLGRLTIDAITQRDYPQIEGNVLFFAAVFLAINLLVDLSYSWFDPRIRYE
jgi:peptide/nickel transport system permease protein